MKRLVSVLVIFLFVAQYVSAVSLRKRREADPEGEDTGVVDTMISMVGGLASMTKSIPFFGGYITWGQTWVGDTASAVADFDNGIVARIMGGTLPCEIDIDTGITCTGVTDKTNVAHMMMALMDQTPMPNVMKSAMSTVLTNMLDPIMNVIFGGVSLQSV